MMYPDRHHPVFFLLDALNVIGIKAEFAKDERTQGCWGMVFPDFDNRVLVWLIDNRWEHEAKKEDPAAKELLARGAIVAHAQRRDMQRVGGQYLPLAVTPGFTPTYLEKVADCSHVGYVRDEGRARILADIGRHFTLNLAQNVFGRQASDTYCSSKCGIHVPTRYGHPNAYDIPMRPYEIAACAIPLVTNDLPELEELGLIDGETCVTYGAHRTAIEAVRIARASPEIGEAGYKLVSARHEYWHRAEQVKTWLSE
jgi:hypothetical protein